MHSSSGRRESSHAVELWLQTEHLAPRERADRFTADRQLLETLQEAGFAGPDWKFVENVLAEYGIAVIRGWVRKGLIATKCAEKKIRCPVIPDWVRDDGQAPEDIAIETVASAIVHYRNEVLAKGIWDPAKGASLTTFFINQCLFKFANAYRTWAKDAIDPSVEVTVDDLSYFDRTRSGVEDDVIRSMAADHVLRRATNERAARVLAMDAFGFSNAEIAAELETTVEAVRSILKRERAKAAQRMGGRGVS